MAQINDLECYRGETYVVTVTVSPVANVTGWTLQFTLKPSHGSPTTITTQQGTVLNGPAGVFRVSLSAAQTSQDPQAYAYQIWRTDPGLETLVSIGTFTILKD